ncbi:Tkl protein kinase, partial [Globisporangium splendens]
MRSPSLCTAAACALAVVALLPTNGRAQTCSRKTTALTSACGGLCYDGRPCIAYSSNTSTSNTNFTTCVPTAFSECKYDADGACAYECFTNGPNDFVKSGSVQFSAYTFLIPFGEIESEWEAKWNANEQTEWEVNERTTHDETTSLPSKSNNVLQNVEPLQFLNTTKKVTIAGGNSSTEGQRGKVAKLSIATQLLSSQTQLEAVTLANLELDQYPQSTFPTQLKNFSMVNCVINEYPEDLPSMTALENLDFSKNYFKDYPVKFSLSQLRTLNLSTNSMTSFDGDFPNLTTLDLSGNTFSTIPDKVFSMTKLKNLYLQNNSFSNVALTQDQVAFLQNLTVLSINSFGTLSCDTMSQTKVGGVDVCLAGTTTGSGSANGTTIITTSSSGSNTGAIIGGVVGALAVVAIVAGIMLYRRRYHTNKSNSTYQGSTKHSDDRDTVSLWNDQELLSLQVNADDIEDIKKLGNGAFGVVYLAKYRKTRFVACKRLKKDEVTWQTTQSFVAEIKLVAKLDHPRIVALIGVSWTIESDLQALFEYMERGDLRKYLESPKTPHHWTAEKLQLAIDVVEALVYVHSFSPPLVHRDLKSRNVLLGSATPEDQNSGNGSVRAKLSDFGVARFGSTSATMTAGVGTGRWLAPEVIAGSSDYNETCDIFAFGVVLSEIDTHALPYEDVMGANGNRLADVAILQMVATGNLLPTFTPMCPVDILNIARRCMSLDRNDRPSAVEVAYALRTTQKSQDFYVL